MTEVSNPPEKASTTFPMSDVGDAPDFLVSFIPFPVDDEI
jgi:hypothetical protein